MTTAAPELRVVQKVRPHERPIDATSAALFRFGEQCDHRCPMCPNTGRRELRFFDVHELLRRAAFLEDAGIERVVITGGEPTIHPGFWTVVDWLDHHHITWDINTHGGRFAEEEWAERARAAGLERAIVSLHGPDPATSCAMSGTREPAFHRTIAGTSNLVAQGVHVVINCVISHFNAGRLEAFVAFCGERFGPGLVIKFAFPSLYTKRPNWAPIHVRFSEVANELRRLRPRAREVGLEVQFESVPNCVLGDPDHANVGRVGFGETHYLDDVTGDRLIAMDWAETASAVYAPACVDCAAFDRCPGVSRRYAALFGLDELEPMPRERPWWHGGATVPVRSAKVPAQRGPRS